MPKKRLLIGGLALAAALAVLAGVYSNERIAFDLVDKVDAALWPYQRNFGKIRHAIGRFADEMNPFYSEKNILTALDVYELVLSPKDLQSFYGFSKDVYGPGSNVKPGMEFRKVALRHGDKEYDVKMKLHGDGYKHWTGKKKSFQLKSNKNDYVADKSRWIFIVPEFRGYWLPVLAADLGRFMGLPAVDNKLAAVKINGVFAGVYYVESQVNPKLVESQGISNGALVEITDNWVDDRREAGGAPEQYFGGITYNDHHDTPFNLEISNLEAVEGVSPPAVYAKAQQLFDAVRDGDMRVFESLIDAENLGAADAWRTLFGDRHSFAGDNNRMVYRFTSGQFLFFPRSEGELRPLKYEGGSFEAWMNFKTRIVPLWAMMTKSGKVRAERTRWIRYFVEHPEEVLSRFDALAARYEPLLSQDATSTHSGREMRHENAKNRKILEENLRRLKAQYEYHKAYASATVNGNVVDLVLVPDTSFQPLAVTKLEILLKDTVKSGAPDTVRFYRYDEAEKKYLPEKPLSPAAQLHPLFEGAELGFAFDEVFRPKPIRYRYRLVFEGRDRVNMEGFKIGFKALMDEKELPAEDVYAVWADATGDLSARRLETAEEFVARHPDFSWDAKAGELSLKAGTHAFGVNVIVPEGLRLALEAGADVALGPDVSLLSYSPLEVRGTAQNPVVVRASQPGKPFGTFAVAGDEHMASFLKYLDLSGGSEAHLNGMYFSGALCLYHTDVEMQSCHIHDNAADDGLNVKYGKVLILDSKFINNSADQIDLDFCKGVVRGSVFEGSQDDDNGDGLDLSGTALLIYNNTFTRFLDKGISIGEASKAVCYRNTFSRNTRGAAVKDSSAAVFLENRFLDNKTVFLSYQKKQIFGGGAIYIHDNQWTGSSDLFDLDPLSKAYDATPDGRVRLAAFDPAAPVDFEKIFSRTNWRGLRGTAGQAYGIKVSDDFARGGNLKKAAAKNP